mgnify:CR=1 FL=1
MAEPRALPAVRRASSSFPAAPVDETHFISARLSNRLNAPEVIATRKHRTGWDFKGPIERKHPACAMRCERNPLANRISLRDIAGRRNRKIDTGDVRRSPFQAIAMPHDCPAPIHRDQAASSCGRETPREKQCPKNLQALRCCPERADRKSRCSPNGWRENQKRKPVLIRGNKRNNRTTSGAA